MTLTRAQLKDLMELKERNGREQKGQLLLEGRKLVVEALRAKTVLEVYVRSQGLPDGIPELTSGVRVHVLADHDFERLCSVKSPQDILALSILPRLLSASELLSECQRALLFDGVQDPGNVGTMARTASAFGVGGLLFSDGTADPFSPKVVRASAGTILRQKIARVGSVEEIAPLLAERGISLVVPVVKDGTLIHRTRPPERFVLVAGQEGSGSRLREAAGLRVTIPMQGGVESLNVSAAMAAILALWSVG